jgi:hypothetical protein
VEFRVKFRADFGESLNADLEEQPLMGWRFAAGKFLYTFFCGLAVVLIMLQTGFARERGPRVEVVCPEPPTPVVVENKQVLVYELHITNFDTVPLTLKRVEIFGDDQHTQPLTTLADDALAAIMQEAGAAPMNSSMDAATKMNVEKTGSTNARTIGPAKRAILFLWIQQPPGQPAPTALRHRMVFIAGEPDKSKETTPAETALEDFSVAVSRDPARLLAFPFDGGVWVAAGLSNDAGHRRSIFAIDGHIHSPERFAIDWVKVGPNGDTHDGTARNENWWGYGEPIHAVADGEVTQVKDGIPENTPRVLPTPVTLDSIAGNYIVQRIAPNRYVTYAHLQGRSIKVRVHDRVRRGEVLARLGNSGNSTGPHLHFQVTDADSVLQSEGVPFLLDKFTDLGPGADYEIDKHLSIPRQRSLPADNDVVEFTPATKR